MLLISTGGGAAENADVTVETVNAAIVSRDGQQLRVVFAKEEQPALLLKPAQGVWNWSATSKLLIPVENPSDDPVALMLRIESAPGQSLRGSVTIAPHSAGDLTIWLDATLTRSMGMIGGTSLNVVDIGPKTIVV